MSDLDFRQLNKWMPEALEIMALIGTWSDAYNVSREAIERQIKIAYGWALANPKKAPKKSITRFLNNWMGIAKRSGSMDKKETTSTYQENKPADTDLVTGDDWAALRQKLGQRAKPKEHQCLFDCEHERKAG